MKNTIKATQSFVHSSSSLSNSHILRASSWVVLPSLQAYISCNPWVDSVRPALAAGLCLAWLERPHTSCILQQWGFKRSSMSLARQYNLQTYKLPLKAKAWTLGSWGKGIGQYYPTVRKLKQQSRKTRLWICQPNSPAQWPIGGLQNASRVLQSHTRVQDA